VPGEKCSAPTERKFVDVILNEKWWAGDCHLDFLRRTPINEARHSESRELDATSIFQEEGPAFVDPQRSSGRLRG